MFYLQNLKMSVCFDLQLICTSLKCCHLEMASIDHNIETVVGSFSVENQQILCSEYSGPKASLLMKF